MLVSVWETGRGQKKKAELQDIQNDSFGDGKNAMQKKEQKFALKVTSYARDSSE